jgi:hypothetical protein
MSACVLFGLKKLITPPLPDSEPELDGRDNITARTARTRDNTKRSVVEEMVR